MDPNLMFTSPPSRCEYLPDRLQQLQYEVAPELGPAVYMDRLREGWRRFGYVIFRPDCASCRMCQSLRVPVSTFHPSESQRRVWRKNESSVALRIYDNPSSSAEKLDLLARFQQYGHDTKGWPAEGGDDLGLLLANPFPTEEWCYYLGDRLIAVGYVDALPEGLSAIYFYYDPAERHRSLGTLNIMAMIASARQRDVPHVYLGYYVKGCQSLEYKGRFRPNEVLVGGRGGWEQFVP
jgi:arginyl-tRNA--protein-N-Asp/Glu arginylyltransferase